MMYIQKTKTK